MTAFASSAVLEAPSVRQVTASNVSFRNHPDRDSLVVTDHSNENKTYRMSFESVLMARRMAEELKNGRSAAARAKETAHGSLSVTLEVDTIFTVRIMSKDKKDSGKLVLSIEVMDGMLAEIRKANPGGKRP